LIREHETASTSFLQRKLRIGYTRAARLIDQLEDAGLVGPAQGNQPREVLVEPGEVPDGTEEGIEGVPSGGGASTVDQDDEGAIRPWLGG
jgi:hypothetical protein